MIAIIDYGMGNLRSVQKAFERIGYEAQITSDRATVESAEKIVLPGVGAIADAVAELKRELANQRSEIVKDLSGRLAKMQPKTPPAPKTQTVVISEPTSTYEVRGGDTLSVVAQAFNTSVAKIKKMNGLKSDNLRIG